MILHESKGKDFWMREMRLGHLSSFQALEIIAQEEHQKSWWFRLRKRLGLAPYVWKQAQCDTCFRWRWQTNTWWQIDGKVLCPECKEERDESLDRNV